MCRRDPTICRTDPPGHFNLTRNHGMIIVRVRSHFQDNIKGRDKIRKALIRFVWIPLWLSKSLSLSSPKKSRQTRGLFSSDSKRSNRGRDKGDLSGDRAPCCSFWLLVLEFISQSCPSGSIYRRLPSDSYRLYITSASVVFLILFTPSTTAKWNTRPSPI